MPRDRHIVGHRLDVHIRKMHDLPLVFAAYAPRIAEALPVVGHFDLEAVFEFLAEKPELITYTVAV